MSKNKKINEINKILRFLEIKHNVKFQFQLLDVEPPKSKVKNLKFDDYKFCHSSIHNTNHLICFDYYKKNF